MHRLTMKLRAPSKSNQTNTYSAEKKTELWRTQWSKPETTPTHLAKPRAQLN
jgi:hypothetical protein